MASSEIVHLSLQTELSKKFVDKAARELHENPKHTNAHVASLRRWLNSMPHLNCPNDDRILLAFLRQSKYEHSKAQARLDNFATMRTSTKSSIRGWFDRIPMTDPIVQEYLESGVHLPLGFLDDGSFLLLIRVSKWNYKSIPFPILIRFITMRLDRVIEDPRVQVGGLRVLFDLTGFTSDHLAELNPTKNLRQFSQLLQEAYPIRIKGLMFYNEPKIMEMFFKLFYFWLKPSVKERVMHLYGNIRKAYEKVPGLKTLLPIEYGGQNRDVQQTMGELNDDFRKHFEGKTLWDGLFVDETQRPETTKKFMKEYREFDSNWTGTQGTYIRLPCPE